MPEDTSERQGDPPTYTPPPASTKRAASYKQVRQQVRRSRLRNIYYKGICGASCVLLLYLILLACQVVWIYYYVKTSVNPNPRIAINISPSRWSAYVAFMYIFGTAISFMNIVIWGSIALHFITCEFAGLGCFGSWVGALFMPIIALGMMVFPTFGGLIVLSPVQNNAWHHRCDPFRVQVILDGRSYNDPRHTPDVARFYVGNGAAPLFTYDLDQTNSDAWTFHFRTFDAPEDSLPPAFVPVLRAVTYNFVDNTLNGTCTVSGSNDTLCMTGTFNLGNVLSFDLNYNITGTPVHAPSRTFDKQWAFLDDAPSLILRSVEPDNSLGDVILRTAVTKRSDCTQLKVCVDGPSGQGDGAAVGPEVMAPLGLMLARQGDYGIQCTTPPPSSVAESGKDKG